MDLSQVPPRPSEIVIETEQSRNQFTQRDGGFGVSQIDGGIKIEFAPRGNYKCEQVLYNADQISYIGWSE